MIHSRSSYRDVVYRLSMHPSLVFEKVKMNQFYNHERWVWADKYDKKTIFILTPDIIEIQIYKYNYGWRLQVSTMTHSRCIEDVPEDIANDIYNYFVNRRFPF